jgi:hypothetical protein
MDEGELNRDDEVHSIDEGHSHNYADEKQRLPKRSSSPLEQVNFYGIGEVNSNERRLMKSPATLLGSQQDIIVD